MKDVALHGLQDIRKVGLLLNYRWSFLVTSVILRSPEKSLVKKFPKFRTRNSKYILRAPDFNLANKLYCINRLLKSLISRLIKLAHIKFSGTYNFNTDIYTDSIICVL